MHFVPVCEDCFQRLLYSIGVCVCVWGTEKIFKKYKNTNSCLIFLSLVNHFRQIESVVSRPVTELLDTQLLFHVSYSAGGSLNHLLRLPGDVALNCMDPPEQIIVSRSLGFIEMLLKLKSIRSGAHSNNCAAPTLMIGVKGRYSPLSELML